MGDERSGDKRSVAWIVAAVLVSICALGVSIWTGHEQRAFNNEQIAHNDRSFLEETKHDRLSLKPILYFERALAPDLSRSFVGLYLHNAGDGVAQIDSITSRVENLEGLGVPEDIIVSLLPETIEPMVGLRDIVRSIYPETPPMVARGGFPKALASNTTFCMLGIRVEDFDKDWVDAVQLVLSHTTIEIAYRSVYEEEFKETFGFP